ncbi:UDP-glucosyltransferase 29-like [Nicotiana tabacum]|uniref:UDP-glucosyltransferase 29-like n=1 Tax=Nicotiana tabacum TaxID=4097 RepID=A0AC58SAI0_TOBAC|nr:UDP-glycosyltransferase [Nicotiana tabacum]
MNIPAVQLLTFSAAVIALGFHMSEDKEDKFPFPEIYLREYEMLSLKKAINESPDKEFPFCEALRRSRDIVLVKTCRDFEAKYMDYLSNLVSKKIVLFGTLEIHAVAQALELSKVNFIWVIRFPQGGKNSTIEDALPEGFLERVGERGKVLEGWAPQATILQHASIGGFVSYCGWSSFMENVKFGEPIIAMPMHIDQPMNARLVVYIGMGVEAVRDENGKLQSEEIAKAIREVVMEESGEAVRKKARELSEKMNVKGDEELDDVVEELVALCGNK